LNELKAKNVKSSLVFHELQDVIQALISLSISVAKEQFPDDSSDILRKRVELFLIQYNAQHIEKLERYANERGWKKI
jgi:hypothetical protein